MPVAIQTPTAAPSIGRLMLTVEGVRGADAATNGVSCYPCCNCFAEDSE